MWQDKILPAFEKKNPTIDVRFNPTNTNEYNAAIQSQVDGGTGPDLITCRPYDVNRSWIKKGYFEKLDGKPVLDEVRSDWRWTRGRTTAGTTACRPRPFSPASSTTRTSSPS